MKLNEITETKISDEKVRRILTHLGLDSGDYVIQPDKQIITFAKISFNENINTWIKDDCLPFQITFCDKDISVVDTDIRNCKNFPLAAHQSLYISNCPLLTSLPGITPKIYGNLTLNSLPQITSLVGIHEHFQFIKGEFILDDEKITQGGIGLMLIPKLTSIRGYGGTRLEEPFRIISKYVGRPNDIFECQAELIAAGYEEYAQL